MTWPVLAAFVVLAGCGEATDTPPGGADETPAVSTSPTGGGPAAPRTDAPTTAPPEGQRDEVEAAVADLAEHLGVAPEDIAVVSHEDVTWPDGAIGCPQPGMSYTQAQVPGVRLVLAADGGEFSYHAGRSGDFARCESPRLGTMTPPPADS